MRHRKKSEKLSRSRAQRKALVKSLVRAVLINERITTTTSRAKYLRAPVDKLITWAKKDTVFYRRLAYRLLGDHKLVQRLFDVIGPRFKDVEGGYTRVLAVGYRKGDAAPLSLLELTKMAQPKPEVKISEQKEKKAAVIKEKKLTLEKEKKDKKSIAEGMKKIFKRKKG
ncbi:MAG: 50S ribosomal protein L17 [Candidatus Omnitrophota bacterium]